MEMGHFGKQQSWEECNRNDLETLPRFYRTFLFALPLLSYETALCIGVTG